MPYSNSTLRPWTLSNLQDVVDLTNLHTVVDVGAGAGANLEFYWPWMSHTTWTAIEAWAPNVPRFELDVRYACCLTSDVRAIELPRADLYIFGDVLEHMPKEDAVLLWKRARLVSKYQIINMPIVHYHQDAVGGNPFEEHQYHWNSEEILESLKGIVLSTAGPVVGAFIGVS